MKRPTIALLPITPQLLGELDRPELFADTHAVAAGDVDATVVEVVRQTQEFHGTRNTSLPWGGYLAIDPALRRIVGTCAFKGEPDASAVEIAYFTFAGHEGRGYATAMAAALLELAAATRTVTRVLAHTLPHRNASTRVLTKLGFALAGPVHDVEDGTVWRWERALCSYSG
jgi:RimJ/RimL family protein N-acetyltransferase